MVDTSSASTLSKLRLDAGDERVATFKVLHERGELARFHPIAAHVDAISDARELVRDEVLLGDEVVALLLELAIAVSFREGAGVVKSPHLLDEGVKSPVPAAEQGEEPGWGGLCDGVLSMVRAEVQFCNVGGFPLLPPGQ
jgi:hypothetical protein